MCPMGHPEFRGFDMKIDTTAREVTAHRADRPRADVNDQRRELQGRVDALRQAGMLLATRESDVPASVSQWTNWSNG
jgi:hypothetical protein